MEKDYRGFFLKKKDRPTSQGVVYAKKNRFLN